MFVNNLCIL